MVSTGVLWIVEMPAWTEDNLARTNEVKLGALAEMAGGIFADSRTS